MANAEPTQRIYPFIYVDDVRAHLDFLVKAFGFVERVYHVDPNDSEHVHGEATLDDAMVMMSHASPKWGAAPPRKLAALSVAMYVYVSDVDAHCRRARAAGAKIASEPADQPWGDRMYEARDPQGHQWFFASRVRTS